MIQVRRLTKHYGPRRAVDQLDFDVRPGRVTGFLGPNGAGKSTTMRLILGLARPTSGHATVGGHPYRRLRWPLREVGALLDGRSLHPARSAHDHLLGLARTNAIGRRRVDEVLDLVGLTAAAGTPARALSLGMSQRLGIAAALLGDPPVLLLDEPVNGLDTDGIRWIRATLRRWAEQGRTVFVSSHLMSEVELAADHLIVIGHGRLIADTDLRSLIEANSKGYARVRTPRADRLTDLLRRAGARVEPDRAGALRVSGIAAAAVGDIARAGDVPLHELSPRHDSLEDVYTRLTAAPGQEP